MIGKFVEYLRVERRYSELTIREYERDLNEFSSFLQLEPEAFDVSLAQTDDVRAWMVQMLDSGLSARSVKRKLSALRSFYKFMLRVGAADKDITRSVVAPKIDKPLPVFFKETDMEKIEAEMRFADDFPSSRDNLIIEMLYETGMRRAEILGLKDADIDMQQRQIRVFGKRRKERLVPFGDRLAEQIDGYWAFRNADFAPAAPADQPFLVNDRGLPMTASMLYEMVRTRMGEVSRQKRSPHVLRHTFATAMLNNGADINTIKTLMGHASLAATQVYTHTTFQQLKDAYEKAHPRVKKGEKTMD